MFDVLRSAEPGNGVAPRREMTEQIEILAVPAAVPGCVDHQRPRVRSSGRGQMKRERIAVERDVALRLNRPRHGGRKAMNACLCAENDDDAERDSRHSRRGACLYPDPT